MIRAAANIDEFQHAFLDLLWQRIEFIRESGIEDPKYAVTVEDVKNISNKLKSYCVSLASEFKKNKGPLLLEYFKADIQMTLDEAFLTVDELNDRWHAVGYCEARE